MTRLRTTVALASVLALGVSAVARPQSEILIAEGDLLDGVGLVLDIEQLVIGDDGRWAAAVEVDPALFGVLSALVVDGEVLIDSSDLLPGLTVSYPFTSAHSLEIDGDGALIWIPDGPTGSQDEVAVYRNLEPIVGVGEPVGAEGLEPGTTWLRIRAVRPDGFGAFVVQATVEQPGPQSLTYVLARIEPQADGSVATELIVKEGDVLAGGDATIDGFYSINQTLDVNAFGQAMWVGYIDGGKTGLFIDEEPLALEGEPSPVFLANWADLSWSALALNDNGDYAHGGTIEGAFLGQQVLVWNGLVVAEVGDALGAIAPFTVSDLFFGAAGPQTPNPLGLGPDGAIYWAAAWDNPDPSNDVGLFRDYDLIVEEGVTVVEGQRLVELAPTAGNSLLFDVSPAGNRVAIWARLEDGRAAMVTVPSEDGVSTLPSCTDFVASLAAVEGALPPTAGNSAPPAIGTTLLLLLDPGSAAAGPSAQAVPLVMLSIAPLYGAAPCGVVVPGIGELQVDLGPQSLVSIVQGSFPSPPALPESLVFIPVPDDPTLVGVTFYSQGVWVDPDPMAAQALWLSNALRLVVGP